MAAPVSPGRRIFCREIDTLVFVGGTGATEGFTNTLLLAPTAALVVDWKVLGRLDL
jgi:hypothetical protein